MKGYVEQWPQDDLKLLNYIEIIFFKKSTIKINLIKILKTHL